MAKTKIKKLLPDEIKTDAENLPIIEETSLHHIVLRVRDWQETIDKKFGREKAYLEFENEDVNAYKKELLEKGEVDENLNPVDAFFLFNKEYEDLDFENLKRFQLIVQDSLFLDISKYIFYNEEQLTIKNLKLNHLESDKFNKKIIFENVYFEFIDEIESLSLNSFVEIRNSKIEFNNQHESELNLTSGFKIINCIFESVESLLTIHINGDSVINNSHFISPSLAISISAKLEVTNCYFEGYIGLMDLNFKKSSTIILDSNIVKMASTITFGRYTIKGSITINQSRSVYTDLFLKNVVLVKENLDEIVDNLISGKINISFTDLSFFKLHNSNLSEFFKLLNDEQKKDIFQIDWKTCEPKPFQKILSFKSDKKMAIFMQDFALAFKEYISIRQGEDVLVNIESNDDGYSIIFESSSESLINEIDEYKKDFEEFLKYPESQFSLLSKHIDKTENSVELMSLLYKIVAKLKIYKDLGMTISGQSAFTLPSITLTENLSLYMSSITNDFSKSTIHNQQLNQADEISNPEQNNNPSPEEIIKILDKILEVKAESEEEKQVLEDVQKAKNEIGKGNIPGAKDIVKSVLDTLKSPKFQKFALGVAVSAYEILKNWFNLK